MRITEMEVVLAAGPAGEPALCTAEPPGQPAGVAPPVAACSITDVVEIEVASVLANNPLRVAGENREHVLGLAELPDRTPPILVHRPTMCVIDGMHRLRSAELRGERTIAARFYDGSFDDAFVLAVHLNKQHGLPLTRADRRNAARRIVRTHPAWSDRMISSICGVSARTAAAVRVECDDVPRTGSRVGSDGRVRALDTSNARKVAHRIFTERPDSTVREVAHLAGISTSTAHDVRRRMREGGQSRTRTREDRCSDHSPGAGKVRPQVSAPPFPQHRAIETLRLDPAVRSSAACRTMLQLLVAGSLSKAGWQRIISSVPRHCMPLVAAAARDCAAAWLRFADEVQNRPER